MLKYFRKYHNLNYEKKAFLLYSIVMLIITLLLLYTAFHCYKHPSNDVEKEVGVIYTLVISIFCFFFMLYSIIRRMIIFVELKETISNGILSSATIISLPTKTFSEILFQFSDLIKIAVANVWNYKDFLSFSEGGKIELLIHPKYKNKIVFKLLEKQLR